jgi:hypothetical protein
MRLERELTLVLPMTLADRPAPQAALARYLVDAEQVLRDLLQSRKLKPLAPGRFRYTPRPIALGGYRLNPRVRLEAQWQAPTLAIALLGYHLPGLERIEKRVRYAFQATLTACEGALDLRACASIELIEGGLAPLVPRPLFRYLADRLLELILDRLQRRCLLHLPPGFGAWLQRESVAP